MADSCRIGVDVGGTFTDVVLESEGGYFTEKLLTTSSRPSDAVLQGIQRLLERNNMPANSVSLVLHGTTLATNAIIERNGAPTALLTTEGHRDVIEMALENRFDQYDVQIERPTPLIPRYLRLPIRERIDSRGRVLKKLKEESIEKSVEVLIENDISSAAIGYLNSYVNDQHEIQTAEYLSEKLPNVSLSLSSEVCPEVREYERFSTTCANAYVRPLMATYLNELATSLIDMGCSCPFLVMTSNGGLTTLENATQFPIRLVESGPAGGVVLATHKAHNLGIQDAISFDMGGTTAKLSLIEGGSALHSRTFEVDRRYRFKKGSGLPVRIPVVEMVEIGAGGGSIATVDSLRRTRVGPESAGANPGPSCYGLGGTQATVTDADAVLGRLEASKFAGSQLQLDVSASEQAISQDVAKALDLELEDAAFTISEVVDENMASAARSHASEWGKSVVDRTLIAFGGAAPLHAARLMQKLNCSSVVVPVNAGVGSALGFLKSPIAYEVVQSLYMKLSNFNADQVEQVLKELSLQAHEVVSGAVTDADKLLTTATALMRYEGQGYEISVAFDPGECTAKSLKNQFESSYQSLYGRLLPNSDIEVMSWTLMVATNVEIQRLIKRSLTTKAFGGNSTKQEMYDGSEKLSVACVDRELLQEGDFLRGPALITEKDTTTVVPSGFQLNVNDLLDLVLTRAKS